MSPSQPVDAWSDLTNNGANRQLRSLSLVLCESNEMLICIHCKYALQPSGETVSKHLWEKHRTPAKERAGLNAFVRGLNLPDPNSIPKRPDGDPAHPQLLLQSGFTCHQCGYLTTSHNILKRHLSREHGMKLSSQSTYNDRCWSQVMLQSWTQNGKRELWIVSEPQDEGVNLVLQSPQRKRKLSEICQAEADRVAQSGQSLREGTPHDPLLSSNWMRHTGWAQMFSSANLALLRKMIQAPMTTHGGRIVLGTIDGREIASHVAHERKLHMIGIAIDRFFDRCEDTVRNTDHSLLCWLHSQHHGKAYKAPFVLPGREATRKRYRGTWKRIVFFCIRAYLIQAQVANQDILNLPFSADAWRMIRRLWAAVPAAPRYLEAGYVTEACDNADREDSDYVRKDASDGDTDSDTSDDDYEGLSDTASTQDRSRSRLNPNEYIEGEEVTMEPRVSRRYRAAAVANEEMLAESFQDSVAELCAYICTEPYRDGKSGTTIMVYLAGVLGISQDDMSFERPKNYTSKLSAILHSARLCLLEATLPRVPHASLGWGPRPSLGQEKILNKMREKYLCQGSPAPAGELLSLRAYGRVLARTDGPVFRVDWADDGNSVEWEDGSLTMTDFCSLGHRALSMVQESIAAIMGRSRPKLNLSLLRDRISEQRHGYSFVQDPKNGTSSSYLDLADSICALPEHGLMTHNGWNLRSVRQFLKKEEILLERIMLMMYLRGGQASRTTEFFSVRCQNGASTSRGIYVHQGLMMYVTRHSKARRSTNQEFQVARYLPESDSLALATYLIYIRPLVAMIHRSSFGVERQRKLLFCSLEDPTKAWRATRLTSALQRLTRDVAGVDMGVRSYRQLSIAVTEKHLAHLSLPFNRHEEKSGNIQLEVAFAWQSGHRPLQRGTSYGIDAAFPDSLQPALLRVYRWASDEWHRFLNQKNSNDALGGSGSAAELTTVAENGLEQGVKRRTKQKIRHRLV